ncbi:MAG: transglycosylase domain-containing protein, partial [Ramlibacter sp.]
MRALLRWIGLVLVAAAALQLFFIARIALTATMDPRSTAFQRSEAWRIASQKGGLRWRQQWMPYEAISDNLKRAVIASEDGGFTNHEGVDWEALEKAWQRNAKAEEQAARQRPRQGGATPAGAKATPRPPKIVGG